MGYLFRRNSVWWIAYSNGKQMPYYKVIRESTRQTDKDEAERQLKVREGEIADSKWIPPQQTKVKVRELLQDVINDYKVNNRRSIDVVEMRIRVHLEPALGGYRAADLKTFIIDDYVTARLNEKDKDGNPNPASNASINRELAILKRGFTLGLKREKIRSIPVIELLNEDNVRRGYFEPAEFESLCKHLPEHIEPLIRFLYITGWRVSEAKQLMWKDVSFESKRVYLETSKNDEAREFPLIDELRLLLEEQKTAALCPYVFSLDGKPIGLFRRSWKTACKKAGIAARLVHDLRRTAVRNLELKGVPRAIAMLMTGHKTESIYFRYNIAAKSDIDVAFDKMNVPLQKKEAK